MGVIGYVLLVWLILINTESVAYNCRFSFLCCYTVFHLYPFERAGHVESLQTGAVGITLPFS